MNSDRRVVEAIFKHNLNRAQNTSERIIIPHHKLKDRKVREKFNQSLNILWEEVQYQEFEGPEATYVCYKNVLQHAMKVIEKAPRSMKPEPAHIRQLKFE